MTSLTDFTFPNRPLVIGHRGSPRCARENTLESFEAAIRQGADAIELDVRRTGDGTVVVHHNAAIAGCSVRLSSQTYDKALVAALARGYRIPRLAEVAQLCGDRIKVMVELKEGGYEQEVHDIMSTCLRPGWVVYMSFLDDAVRRLKEAVPAARVGLLLGQMPRLSSRARRPRLSQARRLAACHADFVAPHWLLARFGFLKRMRSLGYPVFVWTVNHQPRMIRLARNGAAGIITDIPEQCRPVVFAAAAADR